MTTIRMLHDRKASDGFIVSQYLKGEEYEVRDSVACELINNKSAIETDESRLKSIADINAMLYGKGGDHAN